LEILPWARNFARVLIPDKDRVEVMAEQENRH